MTKLKVSRFNFEAMKTNSVVYVLGRRRSGKSTVLKEMLFHLRRQVDAVVAFCPTIDSQTFFKKIFPDVVVHDHYDERILNQLWDFQEARMQKKLPMQRILIVLDDCMEDKKLLTSRLMRRLHLNGRHLQFFFINIVQYMMDVPTYIRNNVEYVLCQWEPNRESRVKLFKCFFGMFDSFDDFNLVLKAVTDRFGTLIADHSGTSNCLEQAVFSYRARLDLPDFKFGSREFWKSYWRLLDNHQDRRREEQRKAQALSAASSSSASAVSRTGCPRTQMANSDVPPVPAPRSIVKKRDTAVKQQILQLEIEGD